MFGGDLNNYSLKVGVPMVKNKDFALVYKAGASQFHGD